MNYLDFSDLKLNWLYLDVNSYFASVEQQTNPEFRSKPLIVVPLETDSTCAIAVSKEAKRLGIKTGTNVGVAKRMIPSLICVKSNHDKYRDYHEKIMQEIGRYMYIDQVLSIDECAGQLTGKFQIKANAIALANSIKYGIRNNVGEYIKCSIGIAPNRLLAKVAIALDKIDGLVVLDKDNLLDELFKLELSDFTGIGKSTLKRLNSFGVNSVKDLYNQDLNSLKRAFATITGERYYYLLRGHNIIEDKKETQSVGNSQVLSPDMRNVNSAHVIAKKLLQTASYRLRKKGFDAGGMRLEISSNNGSLKDYIKFQALHDDFSLYEKLETMWRRLLPSHKTKFEIKKVGVTLVNLEKQNKKQLSLFDAQLNPKLKNYHKISEAIDKINEKHGKNKVSIGTVR